MRVLIQKVLQGTWSYRITDVLLQVIMFKRRFSRFNVFFRFLLKQVRREPQGCLRSGPIAAHRFRQGWMDQFFCEESR